MLETESTGVCSADLVRRMAGPVPCVSDVGMEPSNDSIFELCDLVRETAYGLHCYLRNGHLEKVYENGIAHRLDKIGVEVRQQHPLTVRDEDGTVLGEYFADLLVEERLIVEIKAARAIDESHVSQVLGYLKSSRIEHGLLINFGAPKLQIRKFVLSNL